ncbi:MAG: hypothetical protein Q8O76_15355, partial [Chloroflexota bacterium]|nr:hypothetical protein [Chloroflexota bacterium]
MARIRSIKPEFWTDEKVGQLSLLGRLLFIGLWNLADDAGVLEDSCLQLKAQLFPYDSTDPEDIEHQLCRLAELGMVLRYGLRGKQLLFIQHFADHQSPQHGTYKYRAFPPPGFTFDEGKHRFIALSPLTDVSVSPHRVFSEDSPTEWEREGRGVGAPPLPCKGGLPQQAAQQPDKTGMDKLQDPDRPAVAEGPARVRGSVSSRRPKRGGN